MHRLPACVALVALCTAALGAQTIRGSVLQRGDSAALAGVLVNLVDANGATVARALTDERGDYRIAAPAAGTFRLRTLRIGFAPYLSDTISVGPGQEVTQRLTVSGIPFRLDTVRVASKSVCRMVSDSGESMSATWDQVRAALSAAQITARSRAINATIVTYDRVLDRHSDRVQKQSFAISSGFTQSAWASRPAETLRSDGYIVTDRYNSTFYYAPDLEVLLSPVWAADHCFRLEKSKDPGRHGIAFEPTRERSRVPEIRGVVWLDRKSSELRSLEFRYVNVSSEQDEARAGGSMEFARMANGGWAIVRWHIRMPVLEQAISSGRAAELRIAEIRTTGGELALAARGTDTLFSRAPMVLAGMVVDSLTGRPIENATVAVMGTGQLGLTDAKGRFSLPDMLPGEYTLELRTPALDALNTYVQWPLIFTDGKEVLTYRMPAPSVVAKTRAASFTGVVVVDSTRAPIAGADVMIPALGLNATTDASGKFRLAEVPPGAHDVVARRLGYAPMNATVVFQPRTAVERTIILARAVQLDTVSVISTAPTSFWEHRKIGLGSFMTRDQIDKIVGYNMSGVLHQMQGLGLMEGRGSYAFIMSKRAPGAIRVQQGFNLLKNNPHPFDAMRKAGFIPGYMYCPESPNDAEFVNMGIKCGCYARVFRDKVLLNPENPARPYNVNEIDPTTVEAVEYYASAAETPSEYTGRADAPCGVMVIHTRRPQR